MDKSAYLIPLGLIYIVPFFLTIGMFFIPESPRWLLQQEQPTKARKALVWLRPKDSNIEPELAEMEATILADKELEKTANLFDLVRDPVDRRRTLLAIGAISTQAASGAMFMIGKTRRDDCIKVFSNKIKPTERTSSKWPMSAMHSRTHAS